MTGEVLHQPPASEPGPAPDAADTRAAMQLPPTVATGSLPSAMAVPQKAGARPAAGAASGSDASRAFAALVVANLGCGLSGMERDAGSNCSAGGGPRLNGLAPVLIGTTTRPSSPEPAVAAPADSDHGGSAAGTRLPSSPGPSPAPGGAAGGSAVGGSGVALAAFLSLAALLRLAPSRAMRRLRLSCEPWLAACFALIPERPG